MSKLITTTTRRSHKKLVTPQRARYVERILLVMLHASSFISYSLLSIPGDETTGVGRLNFLRMEF